MSNPARGPQTDGYEEDGYDESQRAEILEAYQDNPGNGILQTDLTPDLGQSVDPDDELNEFE